MKTFTHYAGAVPQKVRAGWRLLKAVPSFEDAPVTTVARLVDWRLHCTLHRPATITLNLWNVRFHLPPKWGGQGTTSVFVARDKYEPELRYLDKLVKPGDVAVDAGANRGIYTVVLGKLVGSTGRVLSFEPGEDPYLSLRQNIEINGFTHAQAYCAALSNLEGTATLFHRGRGNAAGLGSTNTAGEQAETITTLTLDAVFEREGIERLDVLKMDVEGAEELVLRGASGLFARGNRPVVLFEINPPAIGRMNLSPRGPWDFLRDLGYEFWQLDGSELRAMPEVPGGDVVSNAIAIFPSSNTPSGRA